MARRFYSDEDKARGYTALTVHDGNISRAARETGISESTLRDWRKAWEAEGVPKEIADKAAVEADDFIVRASSLRDTAMETARSKIPEAKVGELTTLIGVLDDKIYRARTLKKNPGDDGPKQIDARAAGELLAGFVQEAMRSAEERQRSVTGAENTPERALPATTG